MFPEVIKRCAFLLSVSSALTLMFDRRPADNVELLAKQYEAVVQALLRDVDRPMSDILDLPSDLLSIVRSPETSSAPAVNGTRDVESPSLRRLKERAEETPRVIAVASYEEGNAIEWTYEALEEVWRTLEKSSKRV